MIDNKIANKIKKKKKSLQDNSETDWQAEENIYIDIYIKYMVCIYMVYILYIYI